MINPASKRLRVRVLSGGIVKEAGTMDAETLGYGTLGQEAGEGTLVGVQYVVIPASGNSPADPGWVMREGDTLKPFEAIIANRLNLKQRLNTASITSAQLMLRGMQFYKDVGYLRLFDMEIDDDDGVFRRTWLQGDIDTAGHFEVSIYVVFESGRGIVVPFERESTLIVRSAA